jgi:hypothetical protein
VDQRKVCPAPVTPRGRSNSSVSITSTHSTLQKCAYSPSEVIAPALLPDRDNQNTPTPKDNGTKTVLEVTTVTFLIKQEPAHPSPFVTPPTLSVIQDTVNIAADVVLSQDVSLRGSSSSIHNEANHMAIDPELIKLANVFPPGIPPPPSNISLPPAMSHTPQFRGAEAHEDSAAPSCSPEVTAMTVFEIQMEAMMARFVQPIWDTIHRLEQSKGEKNIPRILQHTRPGYCSEHIDRTLATRVSNASIAPEVMTQGTRTHEATQVAIPFPSESQVPEPPLAEELVARVDDNEFPTLEQVSRGVRCKCNAAQAITQQCCRVPGAMGPDNRHIPLMNNNSRIKPLFANVITQKAVAQQQHVQNSAAQAHTVQGCKTSGIQGSHKMPLDSNLTEVTVIRFGGLENEEEEHKFRAHNPIEIIQTVQRDLARQTKNPPAVLSGRWST